MSPSLIFIGPVTPDKSFIRISELSAKKVKKVLSNSILSKISAFKFSKFPRAIKLSKKLFLSKYTSSSVFSLPFFTLLFKKLFKFGWFK